MSKRVWLRCEISSGMFSTEFSVEIRTTDGHLLSFFLPKDSVRELNATLGEIEVELIDKGADFWFRSATPTNIRRAECSESS